MGATLLDENDDAFFSVAARRCTIASKPFLGCVLRLRMGHDWMILMTAMAESCTALVATDMDMMGGLHDWSDNQRFA